MKTYAHKIGDWVRFYSNGKLVIGCIHYIQESMSGKITYLTDIGEVGEAFILEKR